MVSSAFSIATSVSTYADYDLKPLLLDAAEAHAAGHVVYEDDGTVVLRHGELARRGYGEALRISPARQYPAIRATFDALNKSLSNLANSPLVDGRTLRQRYDDEAARYEELAASAFADGRFEPDYGTYVVDAAHGDLYLVAPEAWHRLALVTSNSKLLTDPAGKLSWQEIRARLESAVIGFAGVSVGGNVLEGWVREARPRTLKIADLDWVEPTNFNRGERMSLRHVVASRAARFDAKNPYDTPRIPKAHYIAYEQQLVDPYLRPFVYGEGLTRANIDRFLIGDAHAGGREPRLDVIVEEMDNLDLKMLVRERARSLGVDVMMMSDFGNQAHVLWNRFSTEPDAPLGYGVDDATLARALDDAHQGERAKVFAFVGALCGADFAADQFAAWVEGRGEQPTGSLPQSGATAMASGAIGGKELALHVLGHHLEGPTRVVYDLQHRRVTTGTPASAGPAGTAS
jgi:hypothetical protein